MNMFKYILDPQKRPVKRKMNTFNYEDFKGCPVLVRALCEQGGDFDFREGILELSTSKPRRI